MSAVTDTYQGSRRVSRGHVARIVRVFLVLSAVVMVGPFLWTAISSLKPTDKIFDGSYVPKGFTLDHYRRLFEQTNFLRWFANSVGVITAIIILNLVMASLAAYGFVRLRFRGRDFIFKMLLVSIMLPQQVLMIPLFIWLQRLGLINSYFGLILPFSASAVGIFLLKESFESIPVELHEAARVDGASELSIFLKVYVPLARPALATLVVLTFVINWGAFLLPLVIAQDRSLATLPLGLASFSTQAGIEWGPLLASAFLADLPVIIAFLFLQRYFLAGLTQGALKG